jgi:hypothetical protein
MFQFVYAQQRDATTGHDASSTARVACSASSTRAFLLTWFRANLDHSNTASQFSDALLQFSVVVAEASSI